HVVDGRSAGGGRSRPVCFSGDDSPHGRFAPSNGPHALPYCLSSSHSRRLGQPREIQLSRSDLRHLVEPPIFNGAGVFSAATIRHQEGRLTAHSRAASRALSSSGSTAGPVALPLGVAAGRNRSGDIGNLLPAASGPARFPGREGAWLPAQGSL